MKFRFTLSMSNHTCAKLLTERVQISLYFVYVALCFYVEPCTYSIFKIIADMNFLDKSPILNSYFNSSRIFSGKRKINLGSFFYYEMDKNRGVSFNKSDFLPKQTFYDFGRWKSCSVIVVVMKQA